MILRSLRVLFLCLCFTHAVWAQTIRGTVVDSLTREPLAFANVSLPDRKTGTTTDIDGKFRLPAAAGERLWISYVGYQPVRVRVNPGQTPMRIALKPGVQQLGEVVIVAGENPAWRIVRNATEAKEKHRPDRLNAYSYTSYTKVIFKVTGPTRAADSLRRKRAEKRLTAYESLTVEADSISKRQHMLVTETVAEKFFKKPNREFERLLDYKISGFASPLFASLPTDYQPLGFYHEWITLLGKEHLNPLTKNSERVYDFTLTDTTFYENDSVFVIVFEPLGGSAQNLLRGQLSISQNGWALKNVTARPVDPYTKIDFRIQQNYERFGQTWFPTQLNTELYLKEAKIGLFYLMADARSYLSQVRINPPLSNAVFEDVQVDLSHRTDTLFLARHRLAEYDSLELRTFDFYDSLNTKTPVLRIVNNVFEALITGAFSTGKVDWRVDRFLLFNRYEGLRPGVGWRTNSGFSKWLSLGAYTGFGLRDHTLKFGGDVTLRLAKRKGVELQLAYANDLIEPGVHNFFEGYPGALNSFNLRNFFANRFDRVERFRVRSSWSPAASWRVRGGIDRTYFQPRFDYAFFDGSDMRTDFQFTEATGEISYIHRLRQMRMGGRNAVVGLQPPAVSLMVSRSLPGVLDGEFRFTRFEFFYTTRWRTRRIGTTRTTVLAGYLHGTAPVQRQFFGPGAREMGVWTSNSFQTMGLYEFLSDRYVAAFWRHNLGRLYQTLRSKPELILWQAAGVAQLAHPENAAHHHIAVQDFRSGYFESGFGADNILRFNYADVAFFGFGAGVFYRWGPYARPEPRENVAVRLNFSFSF